MKNFFAKTVFCSFVSIFTMIVGYMIDGPGFYWQGVIVFHLVMIVFQLVDIEEKLNPTIRNMEQNKFYQISLDHANTGTALYPTLLVCPLCKGDKIIKNGIRRGRQSYRCKSCGKYFTPLY